MSRPASLALRAVSGAACGAGVHLSCRLLWFALGWGSRHNMGQALLIGAVTGAVAAAGLSAVPGPRWVVSLLGGLALGAGVLGATYLLTPDAMRVAFDRETFLHALRVSAAYHASAGVATAWAALVVSERLGAWVCRVHSAARPIGEEPVHGSGS